MALALPFLKLSDISNMSGRCWSNLSTPAKQPTAHHNDHLIESLTLSSTDYIFCAKRKQECARKTSQSGVENQHIPIRIYHFPLLVFGHFIEMTYTKKVNNVPTVAYTLFCQHGQEVWIGLGRVIGMRF